MLETGIQAPEFTLPDQNGEMHSLKDYRGQKGYFVIFTQEIIHLAAQNRHVAIVNDIRSLKKKAQLCLESARTALQSHKRFEEKQGLTFTILSDTELEVIKAAGDPGEREKELRKSIHGSGQNNVSY